MRRYKSFCQDQHPAKALLLLTEQGRLSAPPPCTAPGFPHLFMASRHDISASWLRQGAHTGTGKSAVRDQSGPIVGAARAQPGPSQGPYWAQPERRLRIACIRQPNDQPCSMVFSAPSCALHSLYMHTSTGNSQCHSHSHSHSGTITVHSCNVYGARQDRSAPRLVA